MVEELLNEPAIFNLVICQRVALKLFFDRILSRKNRISQSSSAQYFTRCSGIIFETFSFGGITPFVLYNSTVFKVWKSLIMVIVTILILKILLILTFNKRKDPLIVSDSDVLIEAPEKSL